MDSRISKTRRLLVGWWGSQVALIIFFFIALVELHRGEAEESLFVLILGLWGFIQSTLIAHADLKAEIATLRAQLAGVPQPARNEAPGQA